jgi:hypothetical protein
MSNSYRTAVVVFDQPISEEGMEGITTILKGVRHVIEVLPGDPTNDLHIDAAKAELRHEFFMDTVKLLGLFCAGRLMSEEEREALRNIKAELSKLKR